MCFKKCAPGSQHQQGPAPTGDLLCRVARTGFSRQLTAPSPQLTSPQLTVSPVRSTPLLSSVLSDDALRLSGTHFRFVFQIHLAVKAPLVAFVAVDIARENV